MNDDDLSRADTLALRWGWGWAGRLAALVAVAGCSTASAPTVHGVPNLRAVDEARHVYRSGQPQSAEAWAYVASLGVRTVVKLDTDTEGSEDGAESVGLVVVRLPWPPANAGELLLGPSSADVHRAVDAMRGGAVLVHCLHGNDRTGLAVEAYRVLVDDWPRSRAHREAIADGFHVELLGLDDAWEDFR